MWPGLNWGWDKGVHVVTWGIYADPINDVSNHLSLDFVNKMKKIDLPANIGYDICQERGRTLSRLDSERLPKMKSVIRVFALLVAIAGLAFATFAPATTAVQTKSAAETASGPGPLDLPGPPPCVMVGACVAQTTSNR